MRKFSKIQESNKENEYVVKATIELVVEAENEGEAGYIADDTLGSLETVDTYDIINIDKKIIGLKESKETDLTPRQWRIKYDNKPIYSYIFIIEGPMGNQQRYIVHLKYQHTLKGDEIYFKESLVNGAEGNSARLSMSSLQNTPTNLFNPQEKDIYKNPVDFEEEIINNDNLKETLDNMITEYRGLSIPTLVTKWMEKGVYKLISYTEKKQF